MQDEMWSSNEKILDYGSKLGPWRGKCLAKAVLALCPGIVRERARARLLRACANHAGAGFGGDLQERNNMEAVLGVLESEHVCVAVVRAESVCEFKRGERAGVWSLGTMGAECIGTVLWCRGHVYVVRGSVCLSCAAATQSAMPCKICETAQDD